MIKHLLLLFFFPLSLLLADDIREVAGHRYPLTLHAKDLDWSLSGADHFRFRLFSVFTGALYTTLSDPGARRLTFTYTRNLGADTLVEQGMRVLRGAESAEDIEARQVLIDQVNHAYQNVAKGDRYTFTIIPGRGTWLHLNDKEILFLQDADFGLWYLNIWLGDQPMSAPLRNALLEGMN
jgi:hypothetical protein